MCAIYDDAGRAAIFDKVLKVGNDVIGIKVIADTFTITPEGTFDWELWRDNIDFIPVNHPVWGGVHGEFLEAAQAIYAVVKPLALASLFALDGHKTTLSIFEAARFGWQKYSDWAQRQNKNGIINLVTSTRNGPDFIVDLPPFPWVATYPQLDLKYAPGGLKDAIPTEWHMSDAVYPGYLKLFPPA